MGSLLMRSPVLVGRVGLLWARLDGVEVDNVVAPGALESLVRDPVGPVAESVDLEAVEGRAELALPVAQVLAQRVGRTDEHGHFHIDLGEPGELVVAEPDHAQYAHVGVHSIGEPSASGQCVSGHESAFDPAQGHGLLIQDELALVRGREMLAPGPVGSDECPDRETGHHREHDAEDHSSQEGTSLQLNRTPYWNFAKKSRE